VAIPSRMLRGAIRVALQLDRNGGRRPALVFASHLLHFAILRKLDSSSGRSCFIVGQRQAVTALNLRHPLAASVRSKNLAQNWMWWDDAKE